MVIMNLVLWNLQGLFKNLAFSSLNFYYYRTYILRATDQVERAQWVKYIEACVAAEKNRDEANKKKLEQEKKNG